MSDGMKRRDFLKVLGVSGAGVATAGCSSIMSRNRAVSSASAVPSSLSGATPAVNACAVRCRSSSTISRNGATTASLNSAAFDPKCRKSRCSAIPAASAISFVVVLR